MTRVKSGTVTRRRHKKILKLAKGYRAGRGRLFREAKRAVMKAGVNAYEGRRLKRRTFRRLWIVRLNAALRARGMSYSRFIIALQKKDVALNRQVLSELAIHEPETFQKVMEFVKN